MKSAVILKMPNHSIHQALNYLLFKCLPLGGRLVARTLYCHLRHLESQLGTLVGQYEPLPCSLLLQVKVQKAEDWFKSTQLTKMVSTRDSSQGCLVMTQPEHRAHYLL